MSTHDVPPIVSLVAEKAAQAQLTEAQTFEIAREELSWFHGRTVLPTREGYGDPVLLVLPESGATSVEWRFPGDGMMDGGPRLSVVALSGGRFRCGDRSGRTEIAGREALREWLAEQLAIRTFSPPLSEQIVNAPPFAPASEVAADDRYGLR